MIKFLIKHPETNRYIFGMVITDGNMDLLKKSHPIHINSEALDLPFFKFNELMLLYYPTNEEAEKDLREKGYITKNTIIHDLKPSTKQ